jgi:rhodanese-related sulfurtransferase
MIKYRTGVCNKMKRLLIIIGLGLLTLLLAACSSSTTPVAEGEIGQVVPVSGGGSYIDIISADLAVMLENKDFFFVNVHIPYEGEIPDTDAHIAFDEILDHLDQLPEDLDAQIVLYCRSGSMSAAAARDLVQAGFTNIYNLDGGFRAWEAAGYEVIHNPPSN